MGMAASGIDPRVILLSILSLSVTLINLIILMAFVRSRALRIYPCYWFMMTACLCDIVNGSALLPVHIAAMMDFISSESGFVARYCFSLAAILFIGKLFILIAASVTERSALSSEASVAKHPFSVNHTILIIVILIFSTAIPIIILLNVSDYTIDISYEFRLQEMPTKFNGTYLWGMIYFYLPFLSWIWLSNGRSEDKKSCSNEFPAEKKHNNNVSLNSSVRSNSSSSSCDQYLLPDRKMTLRVSNHCRERHQKLFHLCNLMITATCLTGLPRMLITNLIDFSGTQVLREFPILMNFFHSWLFFINCFISPLILIVVSGDIRRVIVTRWFY